MRECAKKVSYLREGEDGGVGCTRRSSTPDIQGKDGQWAASLVPLDNSMDERALEQVEPRRIKGGRSLEGEGHLM